ncbi:MAG: glycosyltransferase family 39 protein [Dehalococcoidia bacterium]|nr:glycosyltransferase family 39 protein [Dehalococcoidia bacterium]
MLSEDVAALTHRSPATLSLRSRQFLIIGAALTGILALGLSFRAGALDLPLDRDEGSYAYIGANLTSGIVPYRDVIENKPPGIYVFYAFATIGPDKVTSVRLATDVLFAASMLLVFAITARTYGRTAGLVAALAMAALGNYYPLEAARANTEQIMLPILLVALWSFQKGLDKGSLRWLVLSGFAGGAALLMKQVAVWPALALLGFLALRAINQRNWRRSTAEIGAMAAGIVVPLLATAIYFGALGLLDDLYDWVFRLNSLRIRQDWESGRAQLDNFDPILTLWTYVALGSLILYPFLPRGKRGWHLLIVAWSLANLVGAKMGLRDFPHYFVPVLPGIAILAGAFISSVSHRLATLIRGGPWLRPALAIGVGMGLFAWQADDYVDFYFASTPTEMTITEFGAHGEQIFARSEEIASYVRATTEPEDEILVWAAEAQIYFLSERRAATRYLTIISVFDIIPDGVATIRADLLTRRPKVVVTYTEDSPPYRGSRSGLYELLADEGYVQRFQAGWLAVYRRSESPTP